MDASSYETQRMLCMWKNGTKMRFAIDFFGRYIKRGRLVNALSKEIGSEESR